MTDKKYDDFLNALGARESGGDYTKENTIGYVGKYQMGEAALIDTGYYKKDATKTNDWSGQWTGKDGVNSLEDFKNNVAAQENAVRKLAEQNWKTIQRLELDKYVGQEINGIIVTESGLLAGAHLKGVGKGGLIDFLTQGKNGQDAYGTGVSEYISKFGNYSTPFTSKEYSAPDLSKIDNSFLDLDIRTDKLKGFSSNQNTTQTGNALGDGDWEVKMPLSIINGDNYKNVAPSGIVTDFFNPGRQEQSEYQSFVRDYTKDLGGLSKSIWNTSAAESIWNSTQLNVNLSNLTNNAIGARTFQNIDPVVLDLNDDGVKLTSYNNSEVTFDVDNDGKQERTGWVSNQDGILVEDQNNNGKIDNITETISEYYKLQGSNWTKDDEGKYSSDGLAALKKLDSNNDGKFSSSDAKWNDLKIWVDSNGDAQTDAGELKTLTEAGVKEINLSNITQASKERNEGNIILAKSTYTTTDNKIKQVAAVDFTTNPIGYEFNDVNLGKLATAEDGTKSLVIKNENGETVIAGSDTAQNIFGNIGNDSITGDDRDNWLSGGAGSDTLKGGEGDDILIIDSEDKQENIDGGEGRDIVIINSDDDVSFNLAKSHIETAVGGNGDDVIIGGGTSNVFIDGGSGDDIIIGGAADDALAGSDGNDYVDGGYGDDMLRGHRGNDVLIGGEGNDYLEGGLDDDKIFGGAGNEVIMEGGGNDEIDAGEGYDLVKYNGSYKDYKISRDGQGNNNYKIQDLKTGNIDSIKNIEGVRFTDITVKLSADNISPLSVGDLITLANKQDKVFITKDDLLKNDLDVESDVLTIMTVQNSVGGTARLVKSNTGEVLGVEFTPEKGFIGNMSFDYDIKDSKGAYSIVEQRNNDGTSVTAAMKARVTFKINGDPNDPLYSKQWYLSEINVQKAWEDYTGKGIKIGVFEEGDFNSKHQDLDDNTLQSHKDDVAFRQVDQFAQHKTTVAGVIAAERNDYGIVGVAYGAKLDGYSWDADETGLEHLKDVDIANNSWGVVGKFGDNGFDQNNYYQNSLKDIADSVKEGRDGLGTINVFAGGNSRAEGDNVNYHNLQNSRFVITTGSINQPGDLATLTEASTPFSNPGDAILVSAPGSNINSTGNLLTNENGSQFLGEFSSSQGTSFSAPIISGIVALMLEANPELGYRDVQKILALSARKFNDPNTIWQENGAENWNGGAMHFSHDYGFGIVDAAAAVRLAETWNEQSTYYNEKSLVAENNERIAIVDNDTVGKKFTIANSNMHNIETVEIEVNLSHLNLSDLTIKLVSPDGTESILMDRPQGSVYQGGLVFNFSSRAFLGENVDGDWRLLITDSKTGDVGYLNSWKLKFYGELDDGKSDLYVYTDEFSKLTDGSRGIIADTDGGVDTINASAVSTDTTINLNAGKTSKIAGRDVLISGGTPGEEYYQYKASLPTKEAALAAKNNQLTSKNQLLTTKQTELSGLETAINAKVLAYNQKQAEYQTALDTYNVQKAWFDNNILIYVAYADNKLRPRNDDQYIYQSKITGKSFSVYGSEQKQKVDNFTNATNIVNQKGSEANAIAAGVNELIAKRSSLPEEIGKLSNEIADISHQVTTLQSDINFIKAYINSFNENGASSIENAYTGDGNDKIIGSDLANEIWGGRGYNTLTGNGGKDTFIIKKNTATVDTITDFKAGEDKIDLSYFKNANGNTVSNISLSDLSISQNGTNAEIKFISGQKIILQNVNAGQIVTDSFVFTAKAVDPINNPDPIIIPKNIINGNDMAETIIGTSKDDVIKAGAGLDVVNAHAGNDEIDGGDGNDMIYGGDGDDVIYGGNGNDSLYGDGNLNLQTKAVDNYENRNGNNKIFGGAGDDNILGGSGKDYIDGGTGNDLMFGDAGDDILIGGDGNNQIQAGAGNDVIDFGTGNGVISGDQFNMALGGTGSDRFVVSDKSITFKHKYDIIGDFDINDPNEKIDLSRVGGVNKYSDLKIIQQGTDAYIIFNTSSFGYSQVIILENVDASKLNSSNFIITNEAPNATSDSIATNEDQSVIINILANDSDDKTSISKTKITVIQPTNGTVTVNYDGTVTYKPKDNFNGIDQFEYQLTDAGGLVSPKAKVIVNIDPINDAPIVTKIIGDQSFSSTKEISFKVDDIFKEVDGENLSYGATLLDGSPLPDWIHFNSETKTFFGTASQDSGDFIIKLTATDDSKNSTSTNIKMFRGSEAKDDNVSTLEDKSIVIDVVANDGGSKVNISKSKIIITTGPANGSIVINNDGTIKYTPKANFNGSDQFEYKFIDDKGATSTPAKVIINIGSVNDAPVVTLFSSLTNEDTVKIIDVLATASDVDRDILTISSITQPPHGTATIITNPQTGYQTISYNPTANYNGSDSFTYTISDGNGGLATKTIALNIVAVNDIPTANNIASTIDEDTSTTIDVLATFTDVDGDILTISSITQPAHGKTTIITNPQTGYKTISYNPTANYNGNDSFSYTVSDGRGGVATKTANLTINPVNDAPISVQTVSDQMFYSTREINFKVDNTFWDVDGNTLTYSATLADGSSLPNWISFNSTTKTFSGVAPQNGENFIIKLIATDSGGAFTSTNIKLTINGNIIVGTDGDDNLNGNTIDNVIDGGLGNDIIVGGSGSEIIFGGVGNDQLSSGSGNDKLYGEAGDDILRGNSGNQILDGGDGNDKLYSAGSGNNDTLTGGSGSDIFVIGNDIISNDVITDFNVADPNEKIDFSLFKDVATDISQLVIEQVGSDTKISFSSKSKTILIKNVSMDQLTAAKFIGLTDNKNSGGSVVINGTSSNDILTGGAGNDIIKGDKGNDIIKGGLGSNLLTGGTGDDTFVISKNPGKTDIITDFEVFDSLSFDGFVAGTKLSNFSYTEEGNSVTFNLGDGQNLIFQNAKAADVLYYLSFTLVSTSGTAGNDKIISSGAINGGDGNDLISGGSEDDNINGGKGNDILRGGDWFDIFEINKNPGDKDTILDFKMSDMVDSIVLKGFGNSKLSSYPAIQNGNDIIIDLGDGQTLAIKNLKVADIPYIPSFNNKIYLSSDDFSSQTGTDGDDLIVQKNFISTPSIITGGKGNDLLSGSYFYKDLFVIDKNPGDVDFVRYIDAGRGDKVILRGFENDILDKVKFLPSSDTFTLNIDLGDGQILRTYGVQQSEFRSYFDVEKTINPTDGNDILSAGYFSTSVDGGAGNDVITGNNLGNTLSGGDGNDTITAGNGNDTINGGSGTDKITTGAGNDLVNAGSGDDEINVSANGTKIISGGEGSDIYKISSFTGDITISDFDISNPNEVINLQNITNILSLSNLSITQQGLDSVVQISPTQKIILKNIDKNLLKADKFVFYSSQFYSSQFNGTPISDYSLYGSDGDDFINTYGGNDSVYLSNSGKDTVDLGAGNDMVKVGENGFYGNDNFIGGVGNDKFSIDLGSSYGDSNYTLTINDFEAGNPNEKIYISNSSATNMDFAKDLKIDQIGNDVQIKLNSVSSNKSVILKNVNKADLNENNIVLPKEQFLPKERYKVGATESNDSITCDPNAGLQNLLGQDRGISVNGTMTNVSVVISGNQTTIALKAFDPSKDRIKVDPSYGISKYSDMPLAQEGSNVAMNFVNESVPLSTGGSSLGATRYTKVVLENVNLADLKEDDFIFYNHSTSGDDYINGLGGDDYIDGGTGNDYVWGGNGDDELWGGDGNDYINGGTGNDDVWGGNGDDSIDGGTGNDDVWGGNGDDSISGGSGNDELWGGDGNDFISGTDGNDIIYGGDGNDQLMGANSASQGKFYGEAGDDEFDLGNGSNLAKGGIGDDTFYIYGGNNSIYGEEGSDEFYIAPSDGASTTIINDFDPLSEIIMLFDFPKTNIDQFNIYQDGSDVVIKPFYDQIIRLKNIQKSDLNQDNIIVVDSHIQDYGSYSFDDRINEYSISKMVVDPQSYEPDPVAYIDSFDSSKDKIHLGKIKSVAKFEDLKITQHEIQQRISMSRYYDNSPTQFTLIDLRDGSFVKINGFVNLTASNFIFEKAPIANFSFAKINEDNVGVFDVLAKATDADADVLSITNITSPLHGAAQITIDNQGKQKISYNPTTNYNGNDSFTYTISDGRGGFATKTLNIQIASVNDVPTVSGVATQVLNEDSSININLLNGASDVDGNTLTASITANPNHGTLTTNQDRTIKYTPNQNFFGIDSFTYSISDGNGGVATKTLNLQIDSINDVPVIMPIDTQVLNEDSSININLLNGTSDVDGDTLTASITANPNHGTLTINQDGTFNYTPNQNFFGIDSFTYSISDGNGGIVTKTLNLQIDSVNDTPVVTTVAIQTLNEDSSITIDVLASSSDGDLDQLSIAGIYGAKNGSAIIIDGKIVYTPNANYSGQTSFNYTISDGNGGLVTKALNINVVAVNDAPTSNLESIATDEDTQLIVDVLFAANDIDGDRLTIHLINNPANGTAKIIDVNSIDIDGNSIITQKIEYNPNANWSGSDSLVYELSDGNGGLVTKTLNIVVNAINDAPVVVGDRVSLSEDSSVKISILDNDSDIEDTQFKKDNIAVIASALHGSLILNDDLTFTYTPDYNFNGSDNFSYEVKDRNGALSNVANVYLNVASVNDTPTIDGVAESQNLASGKFFSYDLSGFNFSDADNDALTVSVKLADGSNLPSWLVFDSATKILSGTPIISETSLLALQLVVSDGKAETIQKFDLSITKPIAQNTAIDVNVITVSATNETISASEGKVDILEGNNSGNSLQYCKDDIWVGTTYVAWNPYSNDTVQVIGMARSFDAFDGGDGYDTLYLTSNNDAIFLDDMISSNPSEQGNRIFGVENINGGDGDDIVDLSSNRFTYGNATLNGGNGNDVLWGNDGNDTLNGDAGDDNLQGGRGNDIISGDDGNDIIKGYDGNDLIIGGKGADVMIGGNGNDKFIFTKKSDSISSFSNFSEADIILDFIHNEDKIDLYTLNFDSITEGQDSNSSANGLEFYFKNGETIIDDPNSNFAIRIAGEIKLGDGDFNF